MKRFYLLVLPVVLMSGACNKVTLPGLNDRLKPGDLLSDEKYTELVIEIAYEKENLPDAGALNDLRNFLFVVLRKPYGINLKYNRIEESLGEKVSHLQRLKLFEAKYRRQYQQPGRAAVFILYLNTEYTGHEGPARLLALPYGSSSIAVFGKTIGRYAGGFGQPTRRMTEALVLQHQLGHLMGLVNRGTTMAHAHEDSAYQGHCSNAGCLMSHKAETGSITDLLAGDSIPVLDAHCLNDLKKNGGK